MIEYSGRATHAATAATTVEVTVDAGGFWPTRGGLLSVWIRKTAGTATKFAWSVFSEDPAAPPVGEASEYLLAAGLNSAAGDARADCNNDAAIPDVSVLFTDGIPWRPKSVAGLQKALGHPDLRRWRGQRRHGRDDGRAQRQPAAPAASPLMLVLNEAPPPQLPPESGAAQRWWAGAAHRQQPPRRWMIPASLWAAPP